MKLDPEFLLQEVGGEALLVPVGAAAGRFHGVVRLNETAAFLVEKLQNDTTSEALTEALAAEYDGTAEQFAEAVRRTLEQLRAADALIEQERI